MSDPGHDPVPRRDWKLIVGALLALALVIGVIAYKYTGDFTGFAKLEPTELQLGRLETLVHSEN